jgi:hypothetical protein
MAFLLMRSAVSIFADFGNGVGEDRKTSPELVVIGTAAHKMRYLLESPGVNAAFAAGPGNGRRSKMCRRYVPIISVTCRGVARIGMVGIANSGVRRKVRVR